MWRKMKIPAILLSTYLILVNGDESRARKPIVVDAVGNTLPPPSNGPATVGSPVNLLTPDRYEFYTFDESGELVKRLMTLEEIQAIVAAGEEAEGLVTFANDNQPTVAFNFSQPPHTKVHNVVANVQNVLKEQMEAHKKNPIVQPTLDTPDVSDSWSLILPSIFGNTGLDIVPDKSSSAVTPPETDTLEINLSEIDDSLSKEGTNDIINNSTALEHKENVILSQATTSKAPTLHKHEVVTSTKVTSTTTLKTPPLTTKPTTTATEPYQKRKTTQKPIKTTSKFTSVKESSATITTTKDPIKITTAKIPTKVTTNKIPTKLTTPKISTKPTSTKTPIKTTTIKTPYKTSTTKIPSKTTLSTKDSSRFTTIKEIIELTTQRDSSVKLTTVKDIVTKFTAETVAPTKRTTVKEGPNYTKYISTTTAPSTKKIITTVSPQATRSTVLQKISTISATTSKNNEKHITKSTTHKPFTTIIQNISTSSILNKSSSVLNEVQLITNEINTEKSPLNFETNTTFVPISTLSYVTEKVTQKSTQKATIPKHTTANDPTERTTTTAKYISTSNTNPPTATTYKPVKSTNTAFISPNAENSYTEKLNFTTVTTQSVSPAITTTSTELNPSDAYSTQKKPTSSNPNTDNKEPEFPIFDVAQSISQIASDLGNDYMPVPTVSNMMESTKLNGVEMESKENFDLDIFADNDSNAQKLNVSENEANNFIKISTSDPNNHSEIDTLGMIQSTTTENIKIQTTTVESTTVDKVLSESMDDLLSQIVNQPSNTVNDAELKTKPMPASTTEKITEITTTHTLSLPENTSVIEVKENSVNFTENELLRTTTTPSLTTTSTTLSAFSVITTTKDEDVSIKTPPSNNTNIQDIQKLQESNLTNIILNEQTESVLISYSSPSPLTEHSTEAISTKLPNIVQSSTAKVIELKVAAQPTENKTDVNKNKIPETVHKIEEFKKKFQKVNIDEKELANERNNSWKLIPTVPPPKINDVAKDKTKTTMNLFGDANGNKDILLDFSKENQGLEVTTKDLEEDIAKFTELCNELAFRYWNTIVENIDKRRSFVLSPYSITSMLAMMFMGARGATSGEMNDILKLDDMVTFNPHFTLKNISDSIETTPESGVMVSAFIRELYSDKSKGKLLTFYKERAQHFYNGHVEQVNFNFISDIIRRRTNLLVKRYTWGKIAEYIKTNTITMQPPLAAFSANVFQTDCTGSSVEGRDGEMYFVVSPSVRQRRLVPVPAVVYRTGFLAGYDPVLDATAAALGNTNSIISTLFVMPGQQGNIVHGEDLEALEQRLLEANPTTPAWNRLLRTLLPRIGLELQIPRYSHKSIFNVSNTLRDMGLKDLFDADHADLGGLNGPSKDLYLSDMIQSTTFVTCGEGVIGEQHHVEEYPETLGTVTRRRNSRWTSDWAEPRDYQRAFHDPHDVGEAMHLPLHLRPRQARLPARTAQPARLKFDRPFLYFVRHNPSGMILYVGRYNPRLLP